MDVPLIVVFALVAVVAAFLWRSKAGPLLGSERPPGAGQLLSRAVIIWVALIVLAIAVFFVSTLIFGP